ncbi:MAG TPA: TetR-like C-terminal domain-containing protein [Rectinemataceae bacterium]|nr:TetR-like C-terminal domain-containing protein [Rectinemataceae bacterium]
MAHALTTKRAISASLKRLRKSVPLARISVREIVEGCGVNRQTFYIRGVADELASGPEAPEEDKVFICDFYAFAFVGIAVRWIKSGMGEPPGEITRKLAGVVEGSLRRALGRRAKPGPERLLGSKAGSAARRGGER